MSFDRDRGVLAAVGGTDIESSLYFAYFHSNVTILCDHKGSIPITEVYNMYYYNTILMFLIHQFIWLV